MKSPTEEDLRRRLERLIRGRVRRVQQASGPTVRPPSATKPSRHARTAVSRKRAKQAKQSRRKNRSR